MDTIACYATVPLFSSPEVVVVTPNPSKYAAILVGGGPAGIAILLNAHRDGKLADLLRGGLLIVERSATLGSGQIGNYVINSDSTGATFLDSLKTAHEPALRKVLETPIAKRIASAAQGAVPLQDVGELMVLIGEAIRTVVRAYSQSRILTGCTAQSARSLGGNEWCVNVTDENGRTQLFKTSHLVLATGAHQPSSRLQEERVAGERVEKRWGNRLKQSGDVLAHGGLEKVARLLRDKRDPKVAILGGSTSAVAVAYALLHRTRGVSFTDNGITLFHRKPLRVYYPSARDAVADGYMEFSSDDVCPVTNRLYRFAGLRLDSRELLMQIRGVGGRSPEPRVTLHQLKREDAEAVRRIDAADLVIAAFGYRPNALPLFDQSNRAIPLLAQTGPSASLVDDECRVLNAAGTPLPGVYAIGLAAGYKPRGQFGGEPSFSGQANGLWLWQNGIGSIIVRALLTPAIAARAVPTQRPIAEVHARPRATVGFALGAA